MESRKKVIQDLETQRAARHEAERRLEAERLEATQTLNPFEAQQARAAQFARDQKRKEEADLAQVKGVLRSRYFAIPGATDANFERDFPRLLEAHREPVTVEGLSNDASDVVPYSDPAMWGLR